MDTKKQRIIDSLNAAGNLPLFRFCEGLSTVEETGRIEAMNAERFTFWVEEHLNGHAEGEKIGKNIAGKILADDQFRARLRELKAVSKVRAPVWVGEGKERTVELAPPGFDEATGLYTVDGVPFKDDLDAEGGLRHLVETLEEFPFKAEGGEDVVQRRSFAAQIATMLGVFCHQLFPEGPPRPLIVYNANQPATGKSLLARMALAPVHGPPLECGRAFTEREFERLLDATALARLPFLILDDCETLRSAALTRFITTPIHQCRPMRSRVQARVPKVTQVLAAGNWLTVPEGLARFSLVVDLFEPAEARARSITNEITAAWLFRPDTRARFLEALWSLVRAWRDAGMPELKEYRRGELDAWQGVIGGMVTNCGLANPFAPTD